ncbi:alpha/beta hydrolase [Thermodesulfobacteriota bacterium]
MKEELFTVDSDGIQICGVIHIPGQVPAPCIICSHGLFSSKDSPKFIALAEYFARSGFTAIRYDHRGCGTSEGDIGDTTVTGRLHDLASVRVFAREHPSVERTSGLCGSSMGGFISLLAAGGDPSFEAVVVWATPYKLRGQKKDFDAEGYPLLKDSFYDDLKNYQPGDVLGKIKNCLVLHGQNDELVPVWHAEKNYECLSAPKKLEIFPGGDHRFMNEHDRQTAIRLSAEWFKQIVWRNSYE